MLLICSGFWLWLSITRLPYYSQFRVWASYCQPPCFVHCYTSGIQDISGYRVGFQYIPNEWTNDGALSKKAYLMLAGRCSWTVIVITTIVAIYCFEYSVSVLVLSMLRMFFPNCYDLFSNWHNVMMQVVLLSFYRLCNWGSERLATWLRSYSANC